MRLTHRSKTPRTASRTQGSDGYAVLVSRALRQLLTAALLLVGMGACNAVTSSAPIGSEVPVVPGGGTGGVGHVPLVCPTYDENLAPTDLGAQPTQPIGTIPGRFAVSRDGEATYALPIAMPPGRDGIEPRLELNTTAATATALSASASFWLGCQRSIGALETSAMTARCAPSSTTTRSIVSASTGCD